MQIRRSTVITVLLAEKTVQHTVITWAFATNRFDLRDDASFDYRWFAISGGIVAILFALAVIARLRGASWNTPLYMGLAAFDIAGEFVFQGEPGIVITISLIVATVLFVLGIGEMRRNSTSPSMPSGTG